jgi:hypothetical protein
MWCYRALLKKKRCSRPQTRRLSSGSAMTARAQVFGRRNVEPIHAFGRPASEKRQGTKSRWVGHWRCRGLHGELSGGAGLKEDDAKRSSPGFDPRRGGPGGAERADRGFVDQNGAGEAGQSDGPTQARAMPVEIRREWLVSLRLPKPRGRLWRAKLNCQRNSTNL